MAPEQVHGEAQDERSDLFSLGVMAPPWLLNLERNSRLRSLHSDPRRGALLSKARSKAQGPSLRVQGNRSIELERRSRKRPNPERNRAGAVDDAIGYVQPNREGMELLFALPADRPEGGRILQASNLPSSEWVDLAGYRLEE